MSFPNVPFDIHRIAREFAVWAVWILFYRFGDSACKIEFLLWVELSISPVERLKIVRAFSAFIFPGRFENRALQEEFEGVVEKEMCYLRVGKGLRQVTIKH